MPKLSDMTLANQPQSVIIYGPPKSGKTRLAGMLAKHYNVYYVGLENGHSTLFQLPKEWHERIEVIDIPDTKDNPIGIDVALRLMTGAAIKICEKHSKASCGLCISKRKPINTYEFNTLDPAKDIVIFDSLTQLTSSANGVATKGLDPTKGHHEEFKHWRVQGALLEKFLDLVQTSRFNVVVIAHEIGIDQVDKSEKIVPAGGTKNFARTVAKYFGHIIHLSIKNSKHKGNSSSTGSNSVLAGSRTSFEIDIDNEDSISNLFRQAGSIEAEEDSNVKVTTLVKPSSTGSMLSKLRKF